MLLACRWVGAVNAEILLCPGMCRWKLVHGDVFRPPRYLELLAALVGTGVQLALLVLSVILITIAGDSFYPAPQLLPTHRVHTLLRNMQ